MKHPNTGKFLFEVPGHLQKKAIKDNKMTLYYFAADGGKSMWVTGLDIARLADDPLVSYSFNHECDPTVRVDYESGHVMCDERGGWGVTRKMDFSSLEDLAAAWGVVFDVGATTEEVAEMGYRLIYAQHMVDHGLNPENFLPRPPEHLPAFDLVSEWYGDRRAERSGVPLINHVKDGLEILREMGASSAAMSAFCLHPLFQADADLLANCNMFQVLDPHVVALVMEYRSQANRALSDSVAISIDDEPRWIGPLPTPGPLLEVKHMLIADKVQNFADFRVHHLGRHRRSDELDHYFRCWLNVLGIEGEDVDLLSSVMRRWEK